MLKVWTRECEACGNMGEEMRRNQCEKCDTGYWMWEWPYARQFGKICRNLTRKNFPVREFSDFTTKSKNLWSVNIIYGVYTLAVSGTRTGTGTETGTMGDNRCRPLCLFRCSVKGST